MGLTLFQAYFVYFLGDMFQCGISFEGNAISLSM
jgi:hypothetical protein